MSGYVQRSVEERVERTGLAAIFPKPCLPDELALNLRRVLDRQVDWLHAEQELREVPDGTGDEAV